MILGAAHKWLLANGSKILAAPEGRQSQKGPVEQTCRSLLETSHSYLIEQKTPIKYWYYVISHSAHMLNVLPGKLSCRLTTPHDIFYGVKPDARSWFPILSVGYFYHKK